MATTPIPAWLRWRMSGKDGALQASTARAGVEFGARANPDALFGMLGATPENNFETNLVEAAGGDWNTLVGLTNAWTIAGGPQRNAAATQASRESALMTSRALANVEAGRAMQEQAQRPRRRRTSMLLDGMDEQSLLLGGVA